MLTQTVYLDVQSMGEKAVILAKQGEQEGRHILVRLRQQGEDFEPPIGCTGLLALHKPDGKQVLNPLIRTAEGFAFPLTAQMLVVEGEAQGEVRIVEGNELLATATFLLRIYPTPLSDGALESGDEFGALSTIINLAPAMQGHLADEERHTTIAEREQQQSHQLDEKRHLVVGEREAWNGRSGLNILHNSDWRDAINQRGKVSYHEEGQYTVDRWMLTDGTVEKQSGAWMLAGTVCQLLEERLPMAGERLTLSVCIGGVVSAYTAVLTIGTPDWAQTGFCLTKNGRLAVWICGEGVLSWVKLERGARATPYQAKPYAEEWLCCQRTCRVFQSTAEGTFRWAMAPAAQSGYAAVWMPLGVPMRGMPTVTYTGKLQLLTGNAQGRYDVTEIVQADCVLTENALLLHCATAFSSATVGLFLGSHQNIVTLLLDAEIYW